VCCHPIFLPSSHQDAERFAEEDKARRELVDAKNQADSLVYQSEKQLKEFEDKVPAEVKAKVEAKVSALKEAAATDAADKVRAEP
jgi:L1 cell adhesion molecule like protein